jgi:serine/threonine protein kinase
MRGLNHENLMQMFEVFESKNTIYMIMELCQGGSLYDMIGFNGKLGID